MWVSRPGQEPDVGATARICMIPHFVVWLHLSRSGNDATPEKFGMFIQIRLGCVPAW